MKNVAYKVVSNSQVLPDGFITDDHFETDQDVEEGYLVLPKDQFNALFANNVNLLRAFERSKGVVAVDTPNHPVTPVPERVAERLSPEALAQQNALVSQNAQNVELFQQFLAWKNSQSGGGNGSQGNA